MESSEKGKDRHLNKRRAYLPYNSKHQYPTLLQRRQNSDHLGNQWAEFNRKFMLKMIYPNFFGYSKSCDFWQFSKSKNPANRAIAGFYTF
ncbi:hypothetical protein DHW03_02780 [Pedobacter yonginense]|uniref:Uncharacterized protein n=1 Tax=Pedobacter yonginense TaxID=651869 RepID=A0A317EQL9_9SPHI|nr:hypothetical protein DHW03_02780 [Pedobacter yonginense]